MNISDRDIDPMSSSPQAKPELDRQAFFNFIKSIIGIGAIAFPFAANKVGWLGSIIIMIPRKMLFGDIVEYTLKWVWPQITNAVIIFTQVGVCCAYLIFLYQSSSIAFNQIGIELSKMTIFQLTLIFIVPLSLVRKISYFHQVSRIGFYVNLLTFLIIFGDCITIIAEDGFQFNNAINLNSIKYYKQDSFQFVGIACLTLSCNLTILPIRNEMQNKYQFQTIQQVSLVILFFIQILITTFAIWSFSERIDQIIIFNIQNNYLKALTMLAYGICIMMTYALQMFPAVQIIEEYFSMHQYEKLEKSSEEADTLFATDKLSLIVRLTLMFAVYFISYKIPDLSNFINLIGSFFGSIIQFLIPLLAHIICFKNQHKTFAQNIQYIIMAVFTTVAIVFGTYESIKGMI